MRTLRPSPSLRRDRIHPHSRRPTRFPRQCISTPTCTEECSTQHPFAVIRSRIARGPLHKLPRYRRLARPARRSRLPQASSARNPRQSLRVVRPPWVSGNLLLPSPCLHARATCSRSMLWTRMSDPLEIERLPQAEIRLFWPGLSLGPL